MAVTTRHLPTQTEQANMRSLYWDVFWMGLPLVVEWYFLNVFAVRLGASAAHVSALASLRAFALAVGAGLCGMWQGRYSDPVRALSLPVLVYRFILYLLIALVPFLPGGQPDALVALAALSALPQGLAGGLFLGMMRGAVGEQNLAQFMPRRGLLLNVTILGWMIVVGPALENTLFPVNYQVMLAASFAFSCLGWAALMRIRIEHSSSAAPADTRDARETSRGAQPRVQIWKNPRFRYFALVVLAVHCSVFMAVPLGPLRLVRGLGAGDTWIAVFNIAELGAGALAMLITDRLIGRFGTSRLIAFSTIMTATTAFTLSLSDSLPLFAVMQLFFGAGWFALSVLLYMRLSEIVSSHEFPSSAAMYQMLISISLCIAPPFGTFLLDHVMGLTAALFVSALLRVAAAALIWGIDVREVKTPAQPIVQPTVQSTVQPVAQPTAQSTAQPANGADGV